MTDYHVYEVISKNGFPKLENVFFRIVMRPS